MVRGIAIGTFDLFHAGHVNFLKECSARCDILTVAVNTDEFAARYKRLPVIPFEERLAIIYSLFCVDAAVKNLGDEDAKEVICLANANVVFHGDDWQGEGFLKQLGVTQEWLDFVGVRIEYVPYSGITSTSEIIERIVYGDYHQKFSGHLEKGDYCGFCKTCGKTLVIGDNPDYPTLVMPCENETCKNWNPK